VTKQSLEETYENYLERNKPSSMEEIIQILKKMGFILS